MNVVQTWNTRICVRNTHWHHGLNLYPTARIIQVAVGFNLRATAAKAINSMITVKSGISTSYWENTFKTNLLYVKNMVVHIYFRRHAFDRPSRSCIFCKIHDHCCEILLVFNHPIVKAGSRSTEHTVCEELAQLCVVAVYIWFCSLGRELHLYSDEDVDKIDWICRKFCIIPNFIKNNCLLDMI